MPRKGAIDRNWVDFARRTFKRNLNPDIYRDPNKSVYRNVVAMIATTRGHRFMPEGHNVQLAFARAESKTARCIRAVNLIAEREGLSGRLVDQTKDTKHHTYN